MVKFACVSDIHGMWGPHRGLKDKPALTIDNYPAADFLLFAGDILGNYGHCQGYPDEIASQLNEIEEFNAHCAALKELGRYKEIIVVAGNHDWAFEKRNDLCRSRLKDVVYLQDESINIGTPEGNIITIYGSPYQPYFCGWAFNLPPAVSKKGLTSLQHISHQMDHSYKVTKACWDAISDNVDVLITHGPPENILDECKDGLRVGCPQLRARLKELKNLKLHVFGHIHWSRGHQFVDNVQFVNAAICTEQYHPENAIQVVEITV